MATSQNDSPHSQPEPKGLQDKSVSAEDEINLIDYLVVLWRRKYFIVLGTAIPTLIVGLALFFSPDEYKATCTYDLGLDEKGCKVLLDHFYGAENWGLLAARLKGTGFYESAAAPNADIKLEISGTSLIMSVESSSPGYVRKISSIVRDNVEAVLPMYAVKEELSSAVTGFKTKIADIEENRFNRELELQRKKAVLARLKNLEPEESNSPANIILQFWDVRENCEYLPLAYQIQATDVNIVNIEESIVANQKKCEYYNTLQSLDERLLKEVNNKAASYYTLGDFHSFLTNVMSENGNAGTADYLKAYIKRIENVMATTRPVVDMPEIRPVPKGAGAKTAATCAVLLVVTILTAFLLENLPKKQAVAV